MLPEMPAKVTIQVYKRRLICNKKNINKEDIAYLIYFFIFVTYILHEGKH